MHLHIFLLCIKKYLKRNGEFNLDTRPKSNCKVQRLTFSLLINFKTRYVIQRQRRNMNIRLLECSMFVSTSQVMQLAQTKREFLQTLFLLKCTSAPSLTISIMYRYMQHFLQVWYFDASSIYRFAEVPNYFVKLLITIS